MTKLLFPQYLWRIAARNGKPLMLRRGNTPDEPLKKSFRKDEGIWRYFPIGILDYCDIDDAKLYSRNHHWDWLSS